MKRIDWRGWVVGLGVLGLGCGESSSQDQARAAVVPSSDATPTVEPPAGPPALARPTEPAAFADHHVLVPYDATLHLGPQPGAATLTLRLPPETGERTPTPALTMRVVGHEGGRLKVQAAANELGCTPPTAALAGLEVAVWVEPAALARVVGREVEASFADGTSVKLRPGVVVGPPAARVEVSAAGLRLAVPIDEGDISTRFMAEPYPGVPTGLSALAPGPVLVYAGGDPVLPESALMGGGLVFGRRADGDRTLVRVASRCAEVEAVVDPVRLAKRDPGAEPAVVVAPPHEPTLSGAGRGRTWKVEPGKPITWPDGTEAGITTAAREFTIEPTISGDRSCFAVPFSTAAEADGEPLPLCLLTTDVARIEDMLAPSLLGLIGSGSTPFELGLDEAAIYGGLIDGGIGVGSYGFMGGDDEGAGSLGGLGSLSPRSSGGSGSVGVIGSGGLGRAAPSGEAKPGKLAVTGLDAATATKVIGRSRNQLRYCYEKQLELDPGLAGTLSLSLAIEAGKVTTATASSGTLPEDLLRCVERSAKRWSFAGAGSLTVPFTFSAS